MIERICNDLFSMRDLSYAAFQRKLIPTLLPETIIGVRMPALRTYSKKLYKEDGYSTFLLSLPHQYYEENCLHGLLIEQISDYDQCMLELNRFLPFVDNWATCDLLRPKCFAGHKPELLNEIREWISSSHPFTVRFGIEMLMVHFLQTDFSNEYLLWVSEVVSNEYYVNMMVAWYYATALAYRYEETVCYLEREVLPQWVHNKTIQKAVESYRIAPEQKRYLRTLRRKA